MGLKSFPDKVTAMLRKNLGGINMCFGQYESGDRKVRYIVRTMYYNMKYNIMANPANRQHSLLYKYLQQ